jgi:predicted dehydrogenase
VNRPRAAIVGAGLMGYWHARALTRAGAELGLVVDRDADRRKALAARFAGCVTSSGLSDLRARGIAAVHICTPTPSHAALIREALEAGCHVLVEKPLADDAATTRMLVELAASRKLILCPVHQVVFQSGVSQLVTWLDGRRPLHVDLAMCSAGAEHTGADAELVAEILPHPLSLLAHLLPHVEDAGAWHVAAPRPGELRATLEIAETTASILISSHGRPTVNAARVVASNGTAHLDFFHGFAFVQDGAVSRTRKILQPLALSSQLGAAAASNLVRRAFGRQGAYPGLWELVAAFYRQGTSAGQAPIAARNILAVASWRDAIMNARPASAQ